ncbi:hypothetical protein RJ55_08004 [Drechmeria coniospora]|nr:hypothetical protein RJ55_08004 [Drechmeria coniospora]
MLAHKLSWSRTGIGTPNNRHIRRASPPSPLPITVRQENAGHQQPSSYAPAVYPSSSSTTSYTTTFAKNATSTTSSPSFQSTSHHPEPIDSAASCQGSVHGTECSQDSHGNGRYTQAALPVNDEQECISRPRGNRPITKFSITHTSTVTFYGKKGDYTPPFPPIVTPVYCPPADAANPEVTPPPLLHGSGLLGSPRKSNARLMPAFAGSIITFITTDKNPAVVFSEEPPPRFQPTLGPDQGGQAGGVVHKSASDSGGGGGGGGGDSGKNIPAGNVHRPPITSAPRPSFRVVAQGRQVIINDKTFSDAEPGAASRVVAVDGALFTILPNAVVGVGATVQRPLPPNRPVSVATPVVAVVGGLDVTIFESHAVVGGVTLKLPEGRTATVVNGHSVSISPGTLTVDGETLHFKPNEPAQELGVLVSGGELLTAVGQSIVVIHSTTITYGPGIPDRFEAVDGDTITIGPSGVSVHGIVLGGPSANPTTTDFEIVGGATITRIPPTIAVINGVTFVLGPGTSWTTTVIGGQTFTIGPTGLVVGAITLNCPFGAEIATTIVPSGTWLDERPIETAGKQHDADDSAGSMLPPGRWIAWTALCIAAGVGGWV